MRRHGFTLLEVIVALGILSVSLMVLVDSQSMAAFMTVDSHRMATGTRLADEKLREAILTLEQEGWTSQDIEEEGDFSDFGDEEFRGESLHLDLDEELEGYKWAYVVRQIELTLPTDLMGQAGDMVDNGYLGDKAAEENEIGEQDMDLSALGISDQMITDYLSGYIREVRVRVWWGDDPDGEDAIELVTHVINPSGIVTEVEE